MLSIPSFPQLSEEKMRRMLAPPEGKLRVVIDTDTKNEIDDQYALAWALLSQDKLEIEGLYAAPFSFQHHQQPLLDATARLNKSARGSEERVVYAGSYDDWARALQIAGTDPHSLPFVSADEGMVQSYDEIVRVVELLEDKAAGEKVYRGSPGYLKSVDQPYKSDAVDHLIDRAMSGDERPLYVVAIGAATNIACALLQEPRIVDKIVVLWTSAYPSLSNQCNRASLNLMQDLPASRLMFDSGVPHVYLPGFYIGEQLRISLPDVERWIKGRGKIGDYLHHLYVNNPIYHQRGITDHFGRTWIMWDLINIAWLLEPDWVPSELMPSPLLNDEMYWVHDPNRHLMREAVGISRDHIFRDLFAKLEGAPS